MRKGNARIKVVMAELLQLSADELDKKYYGCVPGEVLRLVTFDEDDYEKGLATLFCFNFVPEAFWVTCALDQNLDPVLAQVAKLNPGLEFEVAEATDEIDESTSRRTKPLRICRIPDRDGVNSSGEKTRLTKLDILAIRKTLRHIAFRMGATGMFMNDDPLHPCFISHGGIVFIYGNDHFGVIHINVRHGWFSDGSEWRPKVSGGQFLDNPSKFSQHSMPFDDYRRIADALYKPENRTASKDDELFEKYTGEAEYEGEKMVFHLILYRNTKIVHTLYPQSKRLNRIQRNRLDYKKEHAQVASWNNLLLARVRYLDSAEVVRYVVVVKLDIFTGCRQIWVETTGPDGRPLVCEKIQDTQGNRPMSRDQFANWIEFCDLSKVEKWIKDFDTFIEKMWKSASASSDV